ncbi:MAG: hypothetical protein QNJ30_17370 [Kiloniellales bacterium]|nr:hypothetical protein [Kiloniellales bacterium]
MRAKISCLVLLLVLASCSPYRLVEPKQQIIGERYSVTTPIAWTGAAIQGGETWTINGPALDELNFFAGIGEGRSLVSPDAGTGIPPAFKSRMRANEVMELVTDSLAYLGFKRAKGSKLRPAKFGQLSGFRFEFVFTSEDGLKYAGKAIGAVHQGELHLILFSAPFTHYFPTYNQTVEQIFTSIDVVS